MSTIEVAIPGHTTGADPRPHIVYEVLVIQNDVERTINKRYSDFTALQALIQAPYALPPKRIIATSLVPSAWADAALIEERIIGLYAYLTSVLADPLFASKTEVTAFLGKGEDTSKPWDDEDAIPSTMGVARAADVKNALAKVAEEEADDERVAAFAPGDEDPASKAPVQKHATYYPDWSAGSLPPESLWFGKFDIIYFAFAIPTSSNTISIGGASVLRRLVNAANASGKGSKIVLSIGGWGGSQYFSQAASSAANRSKFIGSMSSAVKTYGLAGVDIDWEYPNSAGAGNPHSSKDAANFLTLVQGLRANLGASKIISSAVPHNPWLGSNGSPLTNVSAYAKEMSWVNIMNYDVWGASSTPGPNAPLGNNCGTSKQPGANATAAFAAWTKAGWPASKLFLGLPLYGYVSRSTKTTLSGSFVDSSSVKLVAEEEVEVDGEQPSAVRNASGQVVLAEDEGAVSLNGAHPRAPTTTGVHALRAGDLVVAAAADDTVHAQATLSSWIGQQIPFNRIVQAGALKKQADGSYAGAGGFKRGWDGCSTTPFIYYQSQSTFVSYDGMPSAPVTAKAKYAQSKGMAGTFTWSIDQDDGHVLTDAIRTASGRPPPAS